MRAASVRSERGARLRRLPRDVEDDGDGVELVKRDRLGAVLVQQLEARARMQPEELLLLVVLGTGAQISGGGGGVRLCGSCGTLTATSMQTSR